MMLRVVCPNCAREIFALPQSAGKVGRCACGASLTVPARSARRPLSTRAATLLIVTGIGVGLAAGLLPGKRSVAAPQQNLAAVADEPGPANLSGPSAAPAPTLARPAVPAGTAGEPVRPLGSPPPAPPSLAARDLFLLFRDDAARAGDLYRGRIIRAHGQVADAPPGEDGAYVAGLVTFEAAELPPAAYPAPVPSRAGVLLRASPSRQAAFRTFPSGTAVEVEGRCAGWVPDPSAPFGAVVVLDECRLISQRKQ
jgi:hypothetical protein